jgi:hypothetical protein
MLGWKDKLGYDFEFEMKTELEKAGFRKYIAYTNPQNPYLWKKKKQKGVDMVLHVGQDRLFVEDRFHSHFYHLRTSWFQSSTMQRFAEYPHTKNDYHIVLTNNPLVYETSKIQELATSQRVFIFSIEEFVHFIKGLLLDRRDKYLKWYYNSVYYQPTNTNNYNNNVYAPDSKTYTESLRTFIEQNKKDIVNNLGKG